MFRKAHILFTLLCAGSTLAITIIMSLLYLHVSESSLYTSLFRSFQNDAATISASLEQSSTISMQWLSRVETQNDYTIFVTDNNMPFLFNSLRGHIDSRSQDLLSESIDAYHAKFEASPDDIISGGNAYSGIRHTEYEFTSPSTENTYYCSLIDIRRDKSVSQIVILCSLGTLRGTILRQRLLFALINLCAAAALSAFSWFFTGRLLKPLRKNHEKQIHFIAAASHELRTPLSAILASNECCLTASPSEAEGFRTTIRKEGRRMNRLIDDMLTLAHAGMNTFPVELKSEEPDTLCLNAYESFEPLCRQNGQTLTLSLPEEPPLRCNCDPDRITQVLSILLHNALSYTPAGGQIELSLAYRREYKPAFEITVCDTGVGISDEDKKHIFDRFYRAEKSRSAKGHFGLGLSIAYEIVTAHRGKLSVHDNPAGGSVFVIRLPG